MSRGGLIALALAAASAGGVALVAQREKPAVERPRVALLTSLPLLFGETFGLDAPKAAAIERIEQHYVIVPIAVADAASLERQSLLLMAHPRAQPADVLVELGEWVRVGGRVLLLADPKLNWDSELPLGDPLRPPPNFADTGLLEHWGVTLDGPRVDGPAMARVERGEVMASSPGTLSSRSRACRIVEGGFIARCIIGRGQATIIADADFLHVEGAGALDGPTAANLDLLIGELARIEKRRRDSD